MLLSSRPSVFQTRKGASVRSAPVRRPAVSVKASAEYEALRCGSELQHTSARISHLYAVLVQGQGGIQGKQRRSSRACQFMGGKLRHNEWPPTARHGDVAPRNPSTLGTLAPRHVIVSHMYDAPTAVNYMMTILEILTKEPACTTVVPPLTALPDLQGRHPVLHPLRGPVLLGVCSEAEQGAAAHPARRPHGRGLPSAASPPRGGTTSKGATGQGGPAALLLRRPAPPLRCVLSPASA
jgi:hypothetical protein